MTEPRIIVVTVDVGVSAALVPDLFVCGSGRVIATIQTQSHEGQVSLHADSLDDLHGWLMSVASAVEALQAPKLALEDVVSTHPEVLA